MESYTFTPGTGSEGMRLDSFLAQVMEGYTRSYLQGLCAQGDVLSGGKPVGKNYRLKAGDVLEVRVPPPKELPVAPQEIPLDIVYEDSALLVVNKPKGLVVHPGAGNEDGTLVNALLWHCGDSLSGIGGVVRPGIVHRIDKDTSGLLVVAKTDAAHQSLSAQIKEHSFSRRYHAIVYGRLREQSGRIDAPIGRHPNHRIKMAVTEKNARSAATRYSVVEELDGFTHVALDLETGRTHQIRVHMAYIGHPVVGDPLYGPKKVFGGMDGQCLHARTIGFQHPVTGEHMEFESPLPQYFEAFIGKHRVR